MHFTSLPSLLNYNYYVIISDNILIMAGWGGNGWNNFGGGFGGGMRGAGNMGMGGNMGGMSGDMMGGHMGMGGMGGGGGMNMPYGYNNMTSFNSRPRFNSMGRGSGGGPMVRPAAKVLTLSEVQTWLERQQPFVLQSVMKTCSNLLVNKHKVPVDDLSDWYKEPEEDKGMSGTILEGGVDPMTTAKNLKRDLKPGVGWTKSDIRHPHKVTTQMKPLPELEIIPPFSAENKEADIDRDKRKMLTNNVNMMQIEVNKICHRFKIPPATLDMDNLDKYPETARAKLKVALTCVKNAERTLTDFLDFLKTEKYSSWNKEQQDKREELLKSMIGEQPQGKPHASGIREEDIELVDAQFDAAGKIIGGLREDEKCLDEMGDEGEPADKVARRDSEG